MRVGIVGLGPIGSLIFRTLHERGIPVVAAVDIAVDKVGKDVGEVAGLSQKVGVPVRNTIEALWDARPDVAIFSTTSRFPVLLQQALPTLERAIHVLTTCEEAVFPFPQYPELSREVDEVGRSRGAVFLAVGVNPGFMMDLWPATVAAVVPRVDRIRVERRVNLTERRGRLQEKLGAGMTPEEARARAREGTIGHVGLTTSAYLLAHALGWQLDAVTEDVDVLVAEAPLPWHRGTLEPGKVKGLRQVARGQVGDEMRLELVLEMALGLENAGDRVRVEGPVPLEVHMAPVNGDRATASLVANALERVPRLQPGLRTVLDAALYLGWGKR